MRESYFSSVQALLCATDRCATYHKGLSCRLNPIEVSFGVLLILICPCTLAKDAIELSLLNDVIVPRARFDDHIRSGALSLSLFEYEAAIDHYTLAQFWITHTAYCFIPDDVLARKVEISRSLSQAYLRLGQHDKALQHATAALDTIRRHPASRPPISMIMADLAYVYHSLNRHRESAQMLAEARSESNKYSGDMEELGGVAMASVLCADAAIAADSANLDRVLTLASQGIQAASGFLRNHPDPHETHFVHEVYLHQITCHSLSATAFARQAKWDDALASRQAELRLLSKVYPLDRYPEGRRLWASTHAECASLFMAKGDYIDAINEYKQSLSILSTMRQDASVVAQLRARCLSDAAMACHSLGRLEEAIQYSSDAVVHSQHQQRIYNTSAAQRANAVTIKRHGEMLIALGRFAEGRRFLDEAVLQQRHIALSSRDPQEKRQLAINLSAVGNFLLDQGDYVAAADAFEQVLDIVDEIYPKVDFPDGHPELASALHNLAVIYDHLERFTEACTNFERALSIWDKHARSNPSMYRRNRAICRDALGNAYRLLGDMEKAKACLLTSMSELRECYPASSFPRGHTDLVYSYVRAGRLERATGNFDKAIEFSQKALSMIDALAPSDLYPHGHLAKTKVLADHSIFLFENGMYDASYEAARDSVIAAYNLGKSVLPGLSPVEGIKYSRAHFRLPWTLVEAAKRRGEISESLYDVLSVHRCAVVAAKQSIRGSGKAKDPAFSSVIDEYNLICRRISQSMLAEPSESRGKSLLALTTKKQEIERRLAALELNVGSTDFAAETTANDIRRVLGDRDAFVEFFRYEAPRSVREEDMLYGAFVFMGDKEPQFVELGRCASIDRLAEAFRTAIVSDRDWVGSGQRLRQLTWDRLPVVSNPSIANVYVCSDGMLAITPWAAMPDGDGVLLERYSIATVPSGRHLQKWAKAINEPRAAPALNSILLVGDVDYGVQPASASSAAEHPQLHESKSLFARLPATSTEITGILTHVQNKRVQLLNGREATPENVAKSLPDAAIVHFATHGYFVSSWKSAETLKSPSRPTVHDLLARQPLLSSGIVLAANDNGDQLANVDAGIEILTADSLALMHLPQMELAVLSTCESGLGAFTVHEGVLGLNWALHAAGAKNVISSLWKVDDDETAALMEAFYAKLLSSGLTISQSLREAQLACHRGLIARRLPSSHNADVASRGRIDFGQETEKPAASSTRRNSAPRQWAAFQLSGCGN